MTNNDKLHAGMTAMEIVELLDKMKLPDLEDIRYYEVLRYAQLIILKQKISSEPMTNNDKLNAMSVEEKAEHIADIHLIWFKGVHDKQHNLSLQEFWKQWLEAESEG